MVPSVPVPLLSRQCAAVTTASVSWSAMSPVTSRSVVLPMMVWAGMAETSRAAEQIAPPPGRRRSLSPGQAPAPGAVGYSAALGRLGPVEHAQDDLLLVVDAVPAQERRG